MAKSAADLKSAAAYMARRRAATKAARAHAKACGHAYEEPTLAGVYYREAGHCYICDCQCDGLGGSRKSPTRATMDHVLALSNGGYHDYNNLRLCCWSCNVRKSNKLASEYAEQLSELLA